MESSVLLHKLKEPDMKENDKLKNEILELMTEVIDGINRMEEITQQNIDTYYRCMEEAA